MPTEVSSSSCGRAEVSGTADDMQSPPPPFLGPSSIIVVVVTFNGQPWLSDCLRSLVRSTSKVGIIVVDNASTDETLRICETFPQVRIIRLARNLGFGRANNIGIAQALAQGAAAVLLLNQDAKVYGDCIERLADLLRKHPNAGIVGPMQWNDGSSALDTTFATHYLADRTPQLLGDALSSRMQASYTVNSLPAAAWLVRAACFLQVGGFDPLFFMYCEDDDFCRRVRRRGFEVRVATFAHFEHARGFHAKASEPPTPTSIAKRVRRVRSNVVLDLKDPARGFVRALLHTCVRSASAAFGALVFQGDWRRSLAIVVALARIVFVEAVIIRRHRTLSERAGSVWLDGALSTEWAGTAHVAGEACKLAMATGVVPARGGLGSSRSCGPELETCRDSGHHFAPAAGPKAVESPPNDQNMAASDNDQLLMKCEP